MKITRKNIIDEGDVVVHRGRVYIAIAQQSRRCIRDCDMYDRLGDNCNGYCWRWQPMKNIVFRYLYEESEAPADLQVVETEHSIDAAIQLAKARTQYQIGKVTDAAKHSG